MTTKLEKLFITTDTVKFSIIEDEDGDVFWAYGHVEAPKMLKEISRWLFHCGVHDTDPISEEQMHDGSVKVEHLWARMNGPDEERFTLGEPVMRESDKELFPVSRVTL